MAPVLVVVAAVLLKFPIARVPPTIPPKLTAPLPTLSVRSLADELLLSVPLKVILLFVVVRLVMAPRVTALP